jgi:hypothetical protein
MFRFAPRDPLRVSSILAFTNPRFRPADSCNNHVTISFSCGVLEVLQHHLRPLSFCKAGKDGDFHGGNTGFQRKGFIPDWCAVSYLLEKSSFAVAREKTILIGSERLGKGQGQSR